MEKLKSRKLWAWIIWVIITGLTFAFARDQVGVVIPWLGGITMLYIGGQSAVDAIGKLKG